MATASKTASYFVIMNGIHRIKCTCDDVDYIIMNRFWINVNIIIYDSSWKIYIIHKFDNILNFIFQKIDDISYLQPCSRHSEYGSLSLIVSHFQKKPKKNWLIFYISKTWKHCQVDPDLPDWSHHASLQHWTLERPRSLERSTLRAHIIDGSKRGRALNPEGERGVPGHL